ncbi:MAG TPA: hypothetical protein VFV00_16395 [Acidimicrobiales bacterium]|nr:hypothetical protein [Acidimicrobiales bacterium]
MSPDATPHPDVLDRASEPGADRRWEYLIVALPAFPPASQTPGTSDAVRHLNDEGDRGWEAITLTPLADGTMAVLFKRPRRT